MLTAYAQGFDNHILYVQNSRDAHMRVHCIPFARALGAHRKLGYRIGSWGSGHVPPPKADLRRILASIAAAGGDWDRVLADHSSHLNVTGARLVPLYGR